MMNNSAYFFSMTREVIEKTEMFNEQSDDMASTVISTNFSNFNDFRIAITSSYYNTEPQSYESYLEDIQKYDKKYQTIKEEQEKKDRVIVKTKRIALEQDLKTLELKAKGIKLKLDLIKKEEQFKLRKAKRSPHYKSS